MNFSNPKSGYAHERLKNDLWYVWTASAEYPTERNSKGTDGMGCLRYCWYGMLPFGSHAMGVPVSTSNSTRAVFPQNMGETKSPPPNSFRSFRKLGIGSFENSTHGSNVGSQNDSLRMSTTSGRTVQEAVGAAVFSQASFAASARSYPSGFFTDAFPMLVKNPPTNPLSA